MERLEQVKRRKKWSALIVCIAMVLVSTLSVMGASAGIGMGYRDLFRKTKKGEKLEAYQFPEYQLRTGVETDQSLQVVEGDVEAVDFSGRDGANLEWEIEGNTRMQSPSYYISSGSTVSVMVRISPTNLSVDVGVVKSDGAYQEIEGSYFICYDFSITQSGFYRIFIDNNYSTTIYANGNYMII